MKAEVHPEQQNTLQNTCSLLLEHFCLNAGEQTELIEHLYLPFDIELLGKIITDYIYNTLSRPHSHYSNHLEQMLNGPIGLKN